MDRGRAPDSPPNQNASVNDRNMSRLKVVSESQSIGSIRLSRNPDEKNLFMGLLRRMLLTGNRVNYPRSGRIADCQTVNPERSFHPDLSAGSPAADLPAGYHASCGQARRLVVSGPDGDCVIAIVIQVSGISSIKVAILKLPYFLLKTAARASSLVRSCRTLPSIW